MKLKVVIDHSTHVAAILSKNGASAAILELVLTGKIKNYISDEIITELRGVLLRPKFKLSLSKVNEFMQIIEKSSIKAVLSKQIKKCRDPNDDIFLSLALEVEANYLVTFDDDLIVLKNIGRTKIVRPGELLKVI